MMAPKKQRKKNKSLGPGPAKYLTRSLVYPLKGKGAHISSTERFKNYKEHVPGPH